jgi:hypothetical protein
MSRLLAPSLGSDERFHEFVIGEIAAQR